MAKLDLVYTPDPLLKQVSKPVYKVDDSLRKFLDDMLETMYAEKGAGLAAVQVGFLKRVFIVDIGTKEDGQIPNPIFFINPEITYYSEEKSEYDEGCLSYPGAHFILERSKNIKINYVDYHGISQELEADDFLARAILHENDHLNGVTMPDYMPPIKKNLFIRKVEKYLREKKLK